jgi:hypothetical protein
VASARGLERTLEPSELAVLPPCEFMLDEVAPIINDTECA